MVGEKSPPPELAHRFQGCSRDGRIMPLSGGTVVDGDGEIMGLIELFDRLFEFTVVVIHKGDTQIV